MCARFTTPNLQQLQIEFPNAVIDKNYRITYNLAPTQLAPVIIADKQDDIQLFHFGLVPHWAKDIKTGFPMMNAKTETVMQLQSYKPLMQHNKRCLVISNGFYEWKTEGKKKLPYRFTLIDREVFSFAGLWSQWKSEDKTIVYESFTILTTTPNQTVGTLHNRMPVILQKHSEKDWLDFDISPNELLKLCVPYPDDLMQTYPVSTEVNKVVNNHQDLILPLNSL